MPKTGLPSPKRLKQLLAKVYAGWSPLQGVSQSILQAFSNCRDRLHKKACQGLKTTDRKEAMEFGTIFHKLIEVGAGMGNRYSKINLHAYMNKFMRQKFPSAESLKLCKIAMSQYDVYREWEHTREEQYQYIDQEPVFNEPFKLPPLRFNPNDVININVPTGVVIPLRGRIDEVLLRNGDMWIQENKTKGQINPSFLQDTIHANIQVMFYAVCAELKYGRPCKGVIYNVIRKPALRQKKKESEVDFLKRVADEIKAQPAYYFYRFRHEFKTGQIERWKREELLPLLYQVYLWWKSIEKNPTNPWADEDGSLNPFHGRRSFGIYDPMTLGKGDLYDYIVYGTTKNLKVEFEMFTELADDEEEPMY